MCILSVIVSVSCFRHCVHLRIFLIQSTCKFVCICICAAYKFMIAAEADLSADVETDMDRDGLV